MKGKKMEGKKIGLCRLRLGSSVPIFLPNIFLPFCLLQYGLQAQAKETSMKSVGTIFMLIGGSWLADNWAMAADRPGSLGAMGLGGTLVSSNARPRARSMARPNATGSAAAGNDAYGRYLDDRLRRAEQYFELRRMNDSYRAQRRPPSLTPEQLIEVNESRLPERLNPAQWQPAHGVIRWPAPLRGDEHVADGARLEALFAERTQDDGGVGGAGYGELRRMRDQVPQRAEQSSVEQFAVARKFLESLAYEARFEKVARK